MKHQTDVFDCLYGAESAHDRTDIDARTERALLQLETGRNICFGGGGDAPAPDAQVGQAALKNAETGEAWMAFMKQQYEENKPRQAEIDKYSREYAQLGLEQTRLGMDQSKAQWDRYNEKVVPLEDELFARAQKAGGAEAQEQAAGKAAADVAQQTQMMQQAQQRQAMRAGINLNSGRFAAINSSAALTGALGSAAMANNARESERRYGDNMLAVATQTGRGLPATGIAASQAGMGAGGAGLGGLTTAMNSQIANAGMMQSGFQGQMQGYQGQANILNQDYQNRLSVWQQNEATRAGNWQAGGALVGTVAAAAMVM